MRLSFKEGPLFAMTMIFCACLLIPMVYTIAVPDTSQVEIRQIPPSEIPAHLKTLRNPAVDVLAYKSIDSPAKWYGKEGAIRGVYLCSSPYFDGSCYHVSFWC